MMQMKQKMSSNAASKIIQYLSVQMQGGRVISFAIILKTGGNYKNEVNYCEKKPSVAISIAKVIGANKKKDGYYEERI